MHQRVTLMSAAALIGREISDKKARLRVVALVDQRIREALEAMSTSDPFGPPKADDVDRAPSADPPVEPNNNGNRKCNGVRQ